LASTDHPAAESKSAADFGRESAMTMCTPDYNVAFVATRAVAP
jgi:hypothetical protein